MMISICYYIHGLGVKYTTPGRAHSCKLFILCVDPINAYALGMHIKYIPYLFFKVIYSEAFQAHIYMYLHLRGVYQDVEIRGLQIVESGNFGVQ